jgi:hypothetical protein
MSPWKSCNNRKKGELVKIGVVIGRIGGEDGVALETEKWITVLERMGHQVCVLSGALEGDVANVELLPGLAFEDAQNELAQAQAFSTGLSIAGSTSRPVAAGFAGRDVQQRSGWRKRRGRIAERIGEAGAKAP